MSSAAAPRWALVAVLLVGVLLGGAGHAAVLGIDLGTLFIKTSAVAPGFAFTIVLDEASKRAMPAIVAFGGEQRLYGTNAKERLAKSPDAAFAWTRRLLGKPFGCPQQQQLIDAGFPYVFKPTERGTIAMEYKGEAYTVEELTAMLLRVVQRNAKKETGISIDDVVITVPVYFSQAERQAVLDAAKIAGLNVISLINENTAAAVQYSIDRQYNVSETHTACFFNMGATDTSVTVVKYSAYNVKSGLSNQTIGQFEVLGSAWDESLGGQAFDLRLTDMLAARVQEQAKKAGYDDDIRSSLRTMAKLRDTSTKTKEILSANKEIVVQVESVFKDLDFKTHVLRSDLYDASADLFERVAPVVESALSAAGVTKDQVDAFVLIGGSSRIPRVHEILKEALQRSDLEQNLNADEAMAQGAAFHAANKSASFRVRKIGMIDKLQFPVGIRLADAEPASDGADPWTKRASLFSRGARVNAKRHVTVPRSGDVTVELFHDEAGRLPVGADPRIAKYTVTGIKDAVAKYSEHGEPKVQLSFELTSDGVVSLVSGEVTVQQTTMEPAPKKASPKAKVSTKDDKKAESEDGGDKQDDVSSDDKAPDEKSETVEMRPVTKTHRTSLTISVASLGPIGLMDESALQASRDTLERLDKADQWTADIAEARNRLEAHIYETRPRMSDSDVEEVSREAEREAVVKALTEAEDWIYDDHPEEESPSLYNNKLASFKELSDNIFVRVREARARPEAVRLAQDTIEKTRSSIERMRKSMEWIPSSSVDALEGALNSTAAYLAERLEWQAQKSAYDNPAFMAADLVKEAKQLKLSADRLLRIPKPPPKPKAKTNNTKAAKSGKAETSKDTEEPAQPRQADSETVPDDDSAASAESDKGEL
ncbi:Hsp70 protein [Plasmodiophora brassicae]